MLQVELLSAVLLLWSECQSGTASPKLFKVLALAVLLLG